MDEGLGSERAGRVLATLVERGVGCVESGEAALGGRRVDATLRISADGAWTRIAEEST